MTAPNSKPSFSQFSIRAQKTFVNYVYVCMYGWMDGCMDGWVYVCMGISINGGTPKWLANNEKSY